jgi:hypothetical protein
LLDSKTAGNYYYTSPAFDPSKLKGMNPLVLKSNTFAALSLQIALKVQNIKRFYKGN